MPTGLQEKAMLQKQKRRYSLVILLLAVSLLSIAPTIALASQQTGTITINATGQATPIDHKETGGAATLSLTGNVRTEGSDPLKISGITGSLQVGGNNYAIIGGQGESNNHGLLQINAMASGGSGKKQQFELVLHGNMQGGNVVFDSHQSKLASMFFLSLSGSANVTLNTFSIVSNSSSSSSSTSSNSTTSSAAPTVTQTVNQTVTETSNNTSTVFSNQTITQPLNVTVTTTLPVNQTITLTETTTLGNSTITQTVTTTVANSTITETTTVANTTITVANTTITVANTTAT